MVREPCTWCGQTGRVKRTDARKLKVWKVATFYEVREGRTPRIEAYTRWYSTDWKGCKIYHVSAETGTRAKKLAIAQRRSDEKQA